MRIGLVCPYSFSRPGGVQAHVWGLGEWLVAQGHDVSVLAPGVPAVGQHDRPAPEFASVGPSVPVRFNGSVARIAWTPRTAAVAGHWLRHGGFDVVHVHEPLTPSVSLQALTLSPAPVVATLHAAREDVRIHVAAGQQLRGRIRRIDHALAVSEVAARLARAYLPAEIPCDVVPNGVWVDDFVLPPDPRRAVGPWRGGARPRIAFLGRDEPRKGLAVFLDAVARLGIDADVVVAGPGDREVPGCRRVDARDDAARARLLATSDVFVAPALGGESFGIVLAEALAAGCQVVASDLPAFVDVLDGAGATFPAGDAGACAAAIRRVLVDPVPAVVVAARAAAFDWSRVGARVEQVYRDVVGR